MGVADLSRHAAPAERVSGSASTSAQQKLYEGIYLSRPGPGCRLDNPSSRLRMRSERRHAKSAGAHGRGRA